KTYLARVQGLFPSGEVVVDAPIECSDFVRHRWVVSPTGKPSMTRFRLIRSRDNERLLLIYYLIINEVSLVECTPITGRTHQIRVHLQHLNHPIIGDPLYNPSTVRRPTFVEEL